MINKAEWSVSKGLSQKGWMMPHRTMRNKGGRAEVLWAACESFFSPCMGSGVCWRHGRAGSPLSTSHLLLLHSILLSLFLESRQVRRLPLRPPARIQLHGGHKWGSISGWEQHGRGDLQEAMPRRPSCALAWAGLFSSSLLLSHDHGPPPPSVFIAWRRVTPPTVSFHLQKGECGTTTRGMTVRLPVRARCLSLSICARRFSSWGRASALPANTGGGGDELVVVVMDHGWLVDGTTCMQTSSKSPSQAISPTSRAAAPSSSEDEQELPLPEPPCD